MLVLYWCLHFITQSLQSIAWRYWNSMVHRVEGHNTKQYCFLQNFLIFLHSCFIRNKSGNEIGEQIFSSKHMPTNMRRMLGLYSKIVSIKFYGIINNNFESQDPNVRKFETAPGSIFAFSFNFWNFTKIHKKITNILITKYLKIM